MQITYGFTVLLGDSANNIWVSPVWWVTVQITHGFTVLVGDSANNTWVHCSGG